MALPEVYRHRNVGVIIMGSHDPSGKASLGRSSPMSSEENKALVRREHEELWNATGNLDAADEIFAPEQAEAAKQEAADFRRGFPDVVSTIEDLIAEGDKVVARWRASHLRLCTSWSG
jgi:hypothetical protein